MALVIIYIATIYIPICQFHPLLSTIHCIITNPIILPKLGQVDQKPKIAVSVSGENIECTIGNKLGHENDDKNPLIPINTHKVIKAGVPFIILIVNGIKQY